MFAPFGFQVLIEQGLYYWITLQQAIRTLCHMMLFCVFVYHTALDECAKEVHDCSMFATCYDQPIGFSCICNTGYTDLHNDVIPGRYCQSGRYTIGHFSILLFDIGFYLE